MRMRHVVDQFAAYPGEHCETSAIGNLLQHNGIRLAEPLLFGLGHGLGFIYWDAKNMDIPFVGGRVKPDLLTENLAARLGLTVHVQETSSVDKAWQQVQRHIERGVPVGLKLDCYDLDYFTSKVHFAGHYAVLYGYDEHYAYMADTRQQGGLVQTRLSSLAQARSAKGPMSSRNRSFTLEPKDALPPLGPAMRAALAANAQDYLHPKIRNIGYKGIAKLSKEILAWPDRLSDPQRELPLIASLMERAGTGGALFRNLYRDFLHACAEQLGETSIEQAYRAFVEIAPLWVSVADAIDRAGRTGDLQELGQASRLLLELADRERTAMTLLL